MPQTHRVTHFVNQHRDTAFRVALDVLRIALTPYEAAATTSASRCHVERLRVLLAHTRHPFERSTEGTVDLRHCAIDVGLVASGNDVRHLNETARTTRPQACI